MNEREYDRLRNEIEAEYHKKIEALELIWRMSNKAPTGLMTNGRGALLGAVRDAVNQLYATFTIRDVEKVIKQQNAVVGSHVRRASLSNTLKRLVEDGLLELVEKGQGKRPSSYRRKVQAKPT